MASRTSGSAPPTDGVSVVDADGHGQTVLDALGDDASRAILEAAGEEALTARELAERQDLALSTTYRKVDTLVGAGLLWERIRLLESGKRSTEYVRAIEDVVVEVRDDEGIVLQISHRDGPEGGGRGWPTREA